MRALNTFSSLHQIASVFLNTFQAETVGARAASLNTDYATTVLGADVILTQTDAVIPAGDVLALDKSVSWLDRVVLVNGWLLTASQRIGQATDYQLNDPTASVQTVIAQGYTGTGAVSNLASGAGISAGNPPLNGAGAFRSYAPVLYRLSTGPGVYASVWLYADTTPGDLYVYNGGPADLYFTGVVYGFAPTGLRP